MQYPKRLIEVDLPIKRISAHARREKSIRHGHISTLHIWWARRPLAACRAVLCASLWPDPGDSLCPPQFKQEAIALMQNWAQYHQALMSAESYTHFDKIQKNPELLKEDTLLRKALLDFIADFANWDNSTNEHYLETSRKLTQVAHEALGGFPGTRPLVADPFAGGGSIPLEALRVGADAFASDLNPVAVLLNKVVLEYIPKYGNAKIEMQDAEGQPIVFAGLAQAVRYWGNWIKAEAEKELAQFYPKDPDGATPIAYLWARTILSEAPDDGTGIPIEVPLIRALWLAKKGKRSVALRWVRNAKGEVQTETVEVTYAHGETLKVRRPLLEIFYPEKASEVEAGTVARGSATCPVTGYTTPVASVRRQLKPRRGGANDARLFAVVTTRPGQQGRFYRLPTEADLDAVKAAEIELQRRIKAHTGELSLLPDEPTPLGGGSGAGRAFNQRAYGMEKFQDLFLYRQQLTLTTLLRKINVINDKQNSKPKRPTIAVLTLLAFLADKQTDSLSALVTWSPNGEFQKNTFGRHALPIVWDSAEVNPLSNSSGNFDGIINWLIKVLEQESILSQNECNGSAHMSSATNHLLPSDSLQIFFTDPPYYDAVPYADLSDFFYVWLKRSLNKIFPKYFTELISPKQEECIVDPIKNKTHNFFEATMQLASSEGRRILSPSGVGIVVFAHKSTAGWEAQLKGMLEAGWIFTGSWPIDTEREARVRAIDSAALASSVHLVCRPRENPDGSLITNYVGDWRDVLAELPKRIHEWMPRLAEEGVVGADAIFACLGPALEVFSRYSSVEKASGEVVSLGEYLEHVWAAVAKEALNMIFAGADTSGFEEDARLTAMWLWTLNTATAESGAADEEDGSDDEAGSTSKVSKGGFALEYDAARKIAQGLGAHLEQLGHLVEAKGSEARLLAVEDRGVYLFGKGQGLETASVEPAKKAKKKSKQGSLLELFEATGADLGDAPLPKAESVIVDVMAKPGKTALDRIHQCMILFGVGQNESLKRMLVEEGVGRDERFWRLAQALSALYPSGTDEKRWVDGVLARKKGLGF